MCVCVCASVHIHAHGSCFDCFVLCFVMGYVLQSGETAHKRVHVLLLPCYKMAWSVCYTANGINLGCVQGQEPPPPPPAPQLYSFRVNDSDLVDDIDTSGHREVDATPPVAAKSLRKGRKRTSDSAAVRSAVVRLSL